MTSTQGAPVCLRAIVILPALAILLSLGAPLAESILPSSIETWQSKLQFWRTTVVSWSPPLSAVYAELAADSLCHCQHLCLVDPNCVAGELDESGEGVCRLASERGDGTLASAGGGAFVRDGRASLGEACLTTEECRLATLGADCVAGVCTCDAPEMSDTGVCAIDDCSQLMSLNVSSGQYWLRLGPGELPVAVFCDMETDGGGWTVFQRRQDDPDQIDFYRDWQSYRDGFGNVSGQFWLGNELIHRLTARRPQELRIDLEDFEGERRFAEYGVFSVADEADKYRLRLESYSGDANDALMTQNGQQFSAHDQDNDVWSSHCSQVFKAGWWYAACHSTNLNGIYLRGPMPTVRADGRSEIGVSWKLWKGHHYSLKTTEMKMRPQQGGST